ncbi:hypothetical protein [Hymenobacter pini]|uniref:hypothetical protein n=1 Tax=Hymenobacter pini TaxID=2880879 RepID=UPI001CF3867A|nr:hypothetical protein [Hymenobacter pini]MCA8829460.1 hypothetical protein [Hymenobacter pini]
MSRLFRIRHALSALLVLLVSAAYGQQLASITSEAATAEQRLAETIGVERLPVGPPSSLTDTRNLAILLQNGDDNRATATQYNTGGAVNQAYIVQVGNYNLADVTQEGRGNTATVSQDGNRNQARLTVDGNDNTIAITQDGNRNVVQGTVEADSRRYQIAQYGNNNTLTQLENSAASPQGYSIEMRGQGIRLSVEQGKVSP